jgi:hypothetical protein
MCYSLPLLPRHHVGLAGFLLACLLLLPTPPAPLVWAEDPSGEPYRGVESSPEAHALLPLQSNPSSSKGYTFEPYSGPPGYNPHLNKKPEGEERRQDELPVGPRTFPARVEPLCRLGVALLSPQGGVLPPALYQSRVLPAAGGEAAPTLQLWYQGQLRLSLPLQPHTAPASPLSYGVPQQEPTAESGLDFPLLPYTPKGGGSGEQGPLPAPKPSSPQQPAQPPAQTPAYRALQVEQLPQQEARFVYQVGPVFYHSPPLPLAYP